MHDPADPQPAEHRHAPEPNPLDNLEVTGTYVDDVDQDADDLDGED